MGKKKGKSVTNKVDVDKSRVKFRAKQVASANIGQGGNAIAINANELGNIRIRTGRQSR
jgi:hypothetical protein